MTLFQLKNISYIVVLLMSAFTFSVIELKLSICFQLKKICKHYSSTNIFVEESCTYLQFGS